MECYYNIPLYNNSIYNMSFTQRSCLVSTKQLLVFVRVLNSRGIKNQGSLQSKNLMGVNKV